MKVFLILLFIIYTLLYYYLLARATTESEERKRAITRWLDKHKLPTDKLPKYICFAYWAILFAVLCWMAKETWDIYEFINYWHYNIGLTVD